MRSNALIWASLGVIKQLSPRTRQPRLQVVAQEAVSALCCPVRAGINTSLNPGHMIFGDVPSLDAILASVQEVERRVNR